MYTDFYEKLSRPWRQREMGAELLTRLDGALRVAVAAAYLIVLGWLAIQGRYADLLRATVVPALTFVLTTGLRAFINAPRPYETNPIKPLIIKNTQGKSMPSRHVASAGIIACALLWINLPLGIMGFVLCGAIAYVRVAGGVHFPRDVVAAIALALACGIIGFVI